MADNDIYDSRGQYEKFKQELSIYLTAPEGRREYQIKNTENMKYFDRLFLKMDASDMSFVRRLSLSRRLIFIFNFVEKDLVDVTREDVDQLMLHVHRHYRTPTSKECFIKEMKRVWKTILPERDERGREDETLVPYVVRHLKNSVDKSATKLREDRLTPDEFRRLVAAFSDDIRMQALLTLMVESLGRPQEILGRKIKNVDIHDKYARIVLSERGKKGPGLLRCIESYFYFTQWYNKHPLRDDPEAYLFINLGNRNKFQQLQPTAANKLIKERCRLVGIDKPITLYSLKRNGVTFCRLRGDSDVDIQHRARWTSTRQLKTYDLSEQEDSFKLELIKRGILKPKDGQDEDAPHMKQCPFCHTENGIAESVCIQCHRPLDRKHIEKQEKEMEDFRQQFAMTQQKMQQMMLRELKRSRYDDLLNRLRDKPEFHELLDREMKSVENVESDPLSPVAHI